MVKTPAPFASTPMTGDFLKQIHGLSLHHQTVVANIARVFMGMKCLPVPPEGPPVRIAINIPAAVRRALVRRGDFPELHAERWAELTPARAEEFWTYVHDMRLEEPRTRANVGLRAACSAVTKQIHAQLFAEKKTPPPKPPHLRLVHSVH